MQVVGEGEADGGEVDGAVGLECFVLEEECDFVVFGGEPGLVVDCFGLDEVNAR